MSFSVSLNGETVGTGMELSLKATADPQATHMSGPVTMQMSGEEYQADVELYAVEEDGELATYSGMSGAWSRSTQEMSEDVMNTSTYEKLAESADSFKLSEDLAEVNGQECFELKGNVEFLGFRQWEEIKETVGHARFTVIPSEWYENNPLSVIEAECLGTPVLGARIGGIPELIDEGMNGMTFESGNTDDLIGKIEAMYNAEFDYSAIADTAMKRYSAEAYYTEIMECYGM